MCMQPCTRCPHATDLQPTPRFLDPYTSGMWWQMIRLPHSSRDAVGAWLQEVRRSSDVLKVCAVP